jgi:hypothetical protein
MKGLSLSLDMARAWHAGRKTVTRRLMRPQPDTKNWKPETMFKQKEWRKQSCLGPGHRTFDPDVWCLFNVGDPANAVALTGREPPYRPGEIVYIQEPFVCIAGGHFPGFILAPHTMIVYQANMSEQYLIDEPPDNIPVYDADEPETWIWQSPVTMLKKFSRSQARIVDVRVERIREITEDEAYNEGVFGGDWMGDPIGEFIKLWNSIYPGSWERNDFIWRYGLERVEADS